MTVRQPSETVLYLKIEDKDGGVVYCNYPTGVILSAEPPHVELDARNQVHLLQLSGPRAYAYTRVGLNGEWLGQVQYNQLKRIPRLKKFASGEVAVVGGEQQAMASKTGTARPGPKLSDRPVEIPKE
jgi:hypothetical protein